MKFKQVKQWLAVTFITIIVIVSSHYVAFADVSKSDAIPSSYQDLSFPPLPDISLPEYERYQLTNGLIVYLMEDHRLPYVSGVANIRTGSRFDPPSQVGLTSLTFDVMRLGGTLNYPPSTLNRILEDKAASIESDADRTSATVSFSSLSGDLNTIFPLFAEVLLSPGFDSQAFELEKSQLRGAIARRNDNPQSIATRELGKLIYGEDSPYSRIIEYETLDNISREDLQRNYQKYVKPENIILGIVGDFDKETMKREIEAKFGQWQQGIFTPSQIDTPQQQKTTGIFIANQPQLTQSNILLGHLGGQSNDPNYATLTVINGILNGFGGRLYNEIRSRQGLAYSVYGVWQGNYDYPGVFVAGGQTKSETTAQFISSIKQEIDKIRHEKVSQKELEYAKESILNSFVFRFQNSGQILSRLITYDFYGYPSDFIFNYQKAVKNTIIDDVLQTAKIYLKPENIVTVIVGNEEKIKQDLSKLNQPITTLDISIN